MFNVVKVYNIRIQVYVFLILHYVIYFNCYINAADNNGCVVPFSSKKDWNIFWPIVYHINGSLYNTIKTSALNENSNVKSSSMVLVTVGDEVLISCSPNYIKERPPTEYLRVICQNNETFLVKGDTSTSDDHSKTIHDLRCDLRAIEEVLETVSDCPTSSTSVHFGYVNPIDNLSYIVGEACYDTILGQTRFIHIHLSTKNNNFNSSATSLRIQPKSFFKKLHPQLGYKHEFMKAFRLDEFNDRLKNILDIKNIPWFEMEKYIDENLLGNQQFYAMTKLSWNYLVLHENLVNIKLLKKDISMLDDDVDIYIGSHGVTKLKDASGNNVPVYLNGKKFPVPEILWIIVKKADKATAFAIFNNPLVTVNDITNNSFCNINRCEEITWLKHTGKKEVYLNEKHGAIICCNYNEFKKSVEEVPNFDNIKELYTGI